MPYTRTHALNALHRIFLARKLHNAAQLGASSKWLLSDSSSAKRGGGTTCKKVRQMQTLESVPVSLRGSLTATHSKSQALSKARQVPIIHELKPGVCKAPLNEILYAAVHTAAASPSLRAQHRSTLALKHDQNRKANTKYVIPSPLSPQQPSPPALPPPHPSSPSLPRSHSPL